MAEGLESKPIDLTTLIEPEIDITKLAFDVEKVSETYKKSEENLDEWYKNLLKLTEICFDTYNELRTDIEKAFELRVREYQSFLDAFGTATFVDQSLEITNSLTELKKSFEETLSSLYDACFFTVYTYISQENPDNSFSAAEAELKKYKNEVQKAIIEVKPKRGSNAGSVKIASKLKDFKLTKMDSADKIISNLEKLIKAKTERNSFIQDVSVSEDEVDIVERLETELEKRVKREPSRKELISKIEKKLDELNAQAIEQINIIAAPDERLARKEEISGFNAKTKKEIIEYIKYLYTKGVKIRALPNGKRAIISNKYKRQINSKTLRDIERSLIDIPKEIVKELNDSLRKTNNRASLNKSGGRKIKRASMMKINTVKKKIKPKTVITFLNDIDGRTMAFYQSLAAVKCGKMKISLKEREKRACRLAATYFQNLVSNTPIDESYTYKYKKTVAKLGYREVDITATEEEMVEASIRSIEQKTYIYEKTHMPDEDFARGDWILHYRGQSFKAFDTDNGNGDFKKEDFLIKSDAESIEKIADYLYKSTEKSRSKNYSFYVTNSNEHIKYLELGGYITDTEPRVGAEYGFLHGVKNKYTYQAPYGFLRLTNAMWNALAERGKGKDTLLLRKGSFRLDASAINTKAVDKLLKSSGVKSEEDIDKLFIREVRA